ncbi:MULTISPECIES: hypothetical protein [Brevibacillus]|nr:hypothetical protein [Brevibacillus sp. HB1.4B]
MKQNTAKILSKVISGVSVAFAAASLKLTIGSMETPQELRKK